jgi:hypothetical protein
MNWKFWKRGKASRKETSSPKATRTTFADRFSRLPEAYAQQQILALQRVVGNSAVLRLLGFADGVAAKRNAAISGPGE